MATEIKGKLPVLNQKIVLSIMTLLLLMLIIVVSSFFPIALDPTKWQTKEFFSDQVITIAISIISLVSTLFIGQTSNAQNPNSELAKSRAKFFKSVEEVDNVSAFHQWVKKVLQPGDIKAIEIRKMREVGIKDFKILDLSIEDIENLSKGAQKIGERYYHKLTKEQYKLLIGIKKGKLKINFVDPSYYLTISSIHSNLTISEKSGKEESKKLTILFWSILWKIIFSIVFAMIFASFAKDLASDDMDNVMALIKFASRMFTLVMSAAMGYRTGAQMNDIDADYINVRISVHTLFKQDDTFVPLSDEELAKEEYEKRITPVKAVNEVKDEEKGNILD